MQCNFFLSTSRHGHNFHTRNINKAPKINKKRGDLSTFRRYIAARGDPDDKQAPLGAALKNNSVRGNDRHLYSALGHRCPGMSVRTLHIFMSLVMKAVKLG